MPTNKNAQIRYFILDKCFSDFSRKYSIEDLLDKVNDVLNDLFGKGILEKNYRNDGIIFLCAEQLRSRWLTL